MSKAIKGILLTLIVFFFFFDTVRKRIHLLIKLLAYKMFYFQDQ